MRPSQQTGCRRRIYGNRHLIACLKAQKRDIAPTPVPAISLNDTH